VERADDAMKRTEIVLYEDLPQVRVRHYFDESKMKPVGGRAYSGITATFPLSFARKRVRAFIQNGDYVRDGKTNDFSGGALDKNPACGATGYGAYVGDGRSGLFISSREMTNLEHPSPLLKSKHAQITLSCSPGVVGLGQEPMVEFVLSAASGAPDKAETYRRSWEGVTPLRAGPTRGGPLGIFDRWTFFAEGNEQSFVRIAAPNVAAVALKKARTGAPNAYALRLLEIGGEEKTATRVTLPSGAKRAFLADQTERPLEALPIRDGQVNVTLTRNQLLTLRFEM
jgi:hypothetical protein